MKSKEELEALKKEIEELSKKLSGLTEDELKELGCRVVPSSELTDEQMEAISGGHFDGVDKTADKEQKDDIFAKAASAPIVGSWGSWVPPGPI